MSVVLAAGHGGKEAYSVAEGSCRRNLVEGDAAEVTDSGTLKRLAEVWTTKWDGRWQFAVRNGCFRHPDGGGAAMVFSVTPVKVYAHAKGDPFGATTHRF